MTSAGSYNATATQNGIGVGDAHGRVQGRVSARRTRRRRRCRSPRPTTTRTVSDIVQVTANANDNVGVAGVRFFVDGQRHRRGGHHRAVRAQLGQPRRRQRRPHAHRAGPRRGRQHHTSAPVTVNVANTDYFQNEVLATGFDLPTTFEFLPDGRMLVAELAGQDQGPAAALHAAGPDAVPADHQHRVGRRPAGHLRPRARPELHHQPLLLRLLHARFARTTTASRASPPTPP